MNHANTLVFSKGSYFWLCETETDNDYFSKSDEVDWKENSKFKPKYCSNSIHNALRPLLYEKIFLIEKCNLNQNNPILNKNVNKINKYYDFLLKIMIFNMPGLKSF